MLRVLGVLIVGFVLSVLVGVVGSLFGLASEFSIAGLFLTLLVALVVLGGWATRKLDEYRWKNWGKE